MGGAGYFERIWESVPAGLEPERFALRREFLLARVAAGERVLDVGCGEGAFTVALAAHGALPTGIDVAAEPLRRAAEHGSQRDLDMRLVAPDGPLPLDDACFDAVWAGEVLEHVVDCVGLLDELHRVLRPGGLLLVSTPNHPPLRVLGLALRPAAFDAHFEPRSDHVRFFTSRTLRTVLETAGFEAVSTRGAGGPPLARAMLLATARRGDR